MTLVEQLADAFRCLPGVGPKSAQRMVFHLLKNQRQSGLHLARCLENTLTQVRPCQRCRYYAEQDLCSLCVDEQRESHTLCVVETAADVMAIEQSRVYKGLYFVLNGKISPLDGLGPDEIGLSLLLDRVQSEAVKEVIVALSPTVEGQATIYHIQHLLAPLKVKLSRLAQGIPSGGELEYLDGYTISQALEYRAALVHD